MINPVLMTLKAQAAAWQCSCSMVEIATRGYMQLMDQQMRLIHEHNQRRTEDFWNQPWFRPDGADLQDHYGKRHLDVDVERI